MTTLGCKVNQYEAAAIRQTLRQAGWTDSDGTQPVAMCVVHSCCVTSTAAQKSRQLIRRLAAAHPGAAIVVTGCYATAEPDTLRHIAGVTVIAGHRDNVTEQLVRLAGSLRRANPPAGPANATGGDNSAANAGPVASSAPSIRAFSSQNVKVFRAGTTANLAPLQRFDDHHRAFVKVQDGCDGFCAYCIVPHLRDRLDSRPRQAILDEIRRLTAVGHREIVLCGVNLGAYGRPTVHRDRWDDDADRLAALVDEAAHAAGDARVRLSSLGPLDVTDELLAVMARHDNVCPYLHLSLQSGSTAVLARMNRRYTAAQYLEAVGRLRAALDRPSITTDVIVGFPGETDDDFAATLEVARQAGFARIHSFPFSPRKGTAAARWDADRPSRQVVRRRCGQLAALEAELARAHLASFVGQTVRVLLEGLREGGGATGLTDRYCRLDLPDAPDDALGCLVRAEITAVTDTGLLGRLVPAALA
ncbi:MAG: tRNA (N(6)-L-threonylcarbamoyladenosine(37)-C(2))-methylthiotransferase MtaB [Planctomycetes bacterium]|nr:tRNA (N(6)-L-threonylcarbamoyladenosine(37)-C(2))-methylthiotransferase MtaB [Planctomycetota bacterium]